jgi:hypothetical protein
MTRMCADEGVAAYQAKGQGKTCTVVYGGPNRKEQDGWAGGEASRFDYERLVG